MATTPIPLTVLTAGIALLILINIGLFMIGFPFVFGPKLSDFPPAIIVYAGQFSGGDKPRPYLSGGISFVVAGFIPA
jgi:hypothetical protein